VKVFVVTKSPVDLDGTTEFVGAFYAREAAHHACTGAGTYTIAEMELDRVYRGDLRDVEVKVVLDHRQFTSK
jgi:hypothetical protein